MGVRLEKQERVRLDGARAKIKRLRLDEPPPNFDALFDPSGVENPLSIHEEGDLTAIAQAETNEILAAIIESRKRRIEEYKLKTDTNYYSVLVFQCEAQRDEFLEKVGWNHLGSKYIDGLALAEMLGVDIEPIKLPRHPPRGAARSLVDHEFIDERKGGE